MRPEQALPVPLLNVKRAALALFDVAIELPDQFEVIPETAKDCDDLVTRAIAWQHRVADRYGYQTSAEPTRAPTYSDDSVFQALHYWTDDEGPGDEAVRMMRSGLPARFLIGDPPADLRWHHGMKRVPVPTAPEPTQRALLAKLVVTTARQQAFALVQWAIEALDRYISQNVPRIEIGATSRRRTALTVRQAGTTHRYVVPAAQAEFLIALAKNGKAHADRTVKHQLLKNVKELSRFIHQGDEKGSESYMSCYQLDDLMFGKDEQGNNRITWKNNAAKKQAHARERLH